MPKGKKRPHYKSTAQYVANMDTPAIPREVVNCGVARRPPLHSLKRGFKESCDTRTASARRRDSSIHLWVGGGGSSRSGSSSSSSSSVPDVELCAWLFFLRLELQERAMLRLIVLVFLLYWLRVQVLRSEVLSVRGGRVLAPFG